MKKRGFVALASAAVLAVAALLGGCGHKHTYEKGWTFDSNTHWHEPTCKHFAMYGNEAKHTYDKEGYCTVCGHEKTKFTFAYNADKTGFILTGQGEFDEETLHVPETYMHLPVVAIGECAFIKGEFAELYIPSSVKEIGEKAFAECPNLEYVSLGSGVQTIGFGAFTKCPYLEQVSVGLGLQYVKESAFKDCRSLRGFVMSEGVKEIGVRAFSGCKRIGSIFIPLSVEKIGMLAFHNMEDLTSIRCGATALPMNWDEDWNTTSASVTWGVQTESGDDQNGGSGGPSIH